MKSLIDTLSQSAFADNSSIRVAVTELLDLDKKTKRLVNIQALLAWDQEVYMPKLGVNNRSEQMVLLESLIHENKTHPRVAELLHTLGVTEENTMGHDNLPEQIRLWLRAKYREWRIASCMPPALLQEIVRLSVQSHRVWIEAREKDDFSLFAPYLEKTISLQIEKANCIGYTKSPYDALLNEFEIGMLSSKLTPLFAQLREKLMPIYAHASEKSQSRPLNPIYSSIHEQKAFCYYLLDSIGFSNDFGRLDVSTHPFSTNIGTNDARITTRYSPEQILSSVFGVLHEAGHAFYDLGIANIYKDTVCADGSSYGIHESQSRFLENIIGRSPEFWKCHYPKLQNIVPAFAEESFDNFMHRIQYITPSTIRVEADEVSYGLHIIIRFEIEKALIEENLHITDLPQVWADKTEQYLGIRPKNNADGVLQDVHWSEGYFGYFPSYELGNMYASTLYQTLQIEMPNFNTSLEQGSFTEIRTWLGQKIHQHGASKTPEELLSLSVESVINYLQNRYIK